MKIAIVILNWNGRKLLENFLASVVAHASGAAVYVADNASTDTSIQFIKTSFPKVKIIQNSTNGGYAKGYNDALKQVDAEVFCLLNSDVEVTAGWLDSIYTEFETHPETAIVQPKILDYKKKDHFEYAGAAGGFLDRYGFAFCRGRIFESIEKDEGQYNDRSSIFWASGACFFIRKSTFDALNGFDEHYFAHFEEIDLCWRAFNKGFDCVYIGQSTVYHVGGATLEPANPKKTYLNFRNSLYTITKNTGYFLPGILFSRMLLDGIAGLRFLLQLKFDHFWAILRAHFTFYSNLPRLLKQRRMLPQKKNHELIQSIVWAYFINKKRRFKFLT
ncbi:glycosyltransferase family 2 protein [Subsaximicrobium wynnwilliamsii]|uniref:Glycosyltransferase family 2 protein n=1 Tax=Subsaximicrobium wynnwilliamsii TaxID=291179 RepID=A0A5C6ZFK1_9FLAO|nr:glycosyltransferase family 2 protein [Subsaximicrobium wynnwilliamsii]TXD82348.1 glycosyltransferase family 2 protein [Subsaximicrobium wynnwilliamsii]TXD87986.1 glycosyltransferase family 2 protein [Subsaximicrobium wynnwilliamsii]TXE01979.1 glycosyltransferase family 2 protein [Subsaximicrobium wynnwilliamsii]